MFNKKITKLTSGAAMLGVAPTLALQAQGGVDAASKEVVKRFLQENSGSSVDFKEFGIKFIIMLLVTCVGWYAACVIFNKLALEKLKGDISLVSKIVAQKEDLEKDIKALDEKISAYKNVNHDTKIDDKDPLKELKLNIKKCRLEIKEKKDELTKAGTEYNNFYNTGKREMEIKASQTKEDWDTYNNKDSAVEKIKKIKSNLEEFKESADLLLSAQNTKAKYEKIKEDYEKKVKFIEENTEGKLRETFEKTKKDLLDCLGKNNEAVLKEKSNFYSIFIEKCYKDDIDSLGKGMCSLREVVKFIEKYDFESTEGYDKLYKYKKVIGEHLSNKDKGTIFYTDGGYLTPPLQRIEPKYKSGVVKLLSGIHEKLGKMLECQSNLKTADEYSTEKEKLLEEKLKLEEESETLQKGCKEKNAVWKTFKEKIDTATKDFSELKIEKDVIDKSGVEGYFAQFKKLGKIDKIISIEVVENKIKALEDEVEKLKPKETYDQLIQEIEEREKTLRESLSRARGLEKEAKSSENVLGKELSELTSLKEQKEKELKSLGDKKNGKQDLNNLKQKEEELSKNIYKFNINPMKYYNEVKEFLAGEIENRNV